MYALNPSFSKLELVYNTIMELSVGMQYYRDNNAAYVSGIKDMSDDTPPDVYEQYKSAVATFMQLRQRTAGKCAAIGATDDRLAMYKTATNVQLACLFHHGLTELIMPLPLDPMHLTSMLDHMLNSYEHGNQQRPLNKEHIGAYLAEHAYGSGVSNIGLVVFLAFVEERQWTVRNVLVK